MHCTHCGKELSEKDTFCTHCGNKVVRGAAGGEPVTASGSTKRSGVIGGIVTTLIIFAVVGALSGSSSDEQFKKDFISSFVDGCVETGGTAKTAQCTCTAQYLVSNYTKTQLTEIVDSYSGGPIPDEAITAVTSCTDEATYRRDFIASCISGGGTRAFCDCTDSYLASNFSLHQRLAWEAEFNKTNKLPAGVNGAVAYCAARN